MFEAGKNQLLAMRKAMRSLCTHRWMETSQGKMALLDSNPEGKREELTVIFLHGHCTNKEFFQKQLESPLFTGVRLIALDLPGYGESEPPRDPQKIYSFPGYASVVAEVIAKLQLNNLVIVGWSLGGHVALELTSLLTQLQGLLITGTPPIEISFAGLGQGFKALDPSILACFGKGDLSQEEAELLATVSDYDYTTEKEFLVEAILQTDEGAKTIYPRSIGLGIGQNEVKIVNEWQKPIAVVAGERDIAINNDYIIHEVKFKNLWEGKVHVIPQAGHAVFMDFPDAFNQILHRFLGVLF